MDQQVPNIVMGTPSPPRLLHWPRTQHSRHSGQCEDNIVIGWPRGGGIHLNAWSYGQIRCEMKYICTDTVPNICNKFKYYLERESFHQNLNTYFTL